jgi:hypothetical protein
MIVESVFHAILREPLRTQLVRTLQNQTADIHTNAGKMEIALLTEMSKPIVEQIVDREINLAAKQLRSKILEERNPRREELESKKYGYAVDNN